MGKASSGKKVAKIASTGGGRTRSRGSKPWGWYGVMGLVAVLGTAGIVTSRSERQEIVSAGTRDQPRIGIDHWHAAYGVYLCDKYAPPIAEPNPLPGLHTHGDEVIHIEPGRSREAGKNATLGLWARSVGMTLTPTRVKVPGGRTYENGDKCGSKTGRVVVKVGDEVVRGDPRKVRLKDGLEITIAFVPEGTKIPELPATALANLRENQATPDTTIPTVPVPSAPETTAPGSPTTAPTTTASSAPPATRR